MKPDASFPLQVFYFASLSVLLFFAAVGIFEVLSNVEGRILVIVIPCLILSALFALGISAIFGTSNAFKLTAAICILPPIIIFILGIIEWAYATGGPTVIGWLLVFSIPFLIAVYLVSILVIGTTQVFVRSVQKNKTNIPPPVKPLTKYEILILSVILYVFFFLGYWSLSNGLVG